MLEKIKPLKLNSQEVNIWFTSDLHFGHNNIITFCNRPYKSVKEMDEALIKNWNSVVQVDDIVFNLGDFAFASDSKWRDILYKLNGKHYLILGNHDVERTPRNSIMEMFERVEQQMLLQIDQRYVYLNHYPFLCYAGSWGSPENAVYALHGHVHSGPNSFGLDSDRLVHLFPYQYDVGVDNNNYTPISWTEVKGKIQHQIDEGVEKSVKEHTIPDEVYKLSD